MKEQLERIRGVDHEFTLDIHPSHGHCDSVAKEDLSWRHRASTTSSRRAVNRLWELDGFEAQSGR